MINLENIIINDNSYHWGTKTGMCKEERSDYPCPKGLIYIIELGSFFSKGASRKLTQPLL